MNKPLLEFNEKGIYYYSKLKMPVRNVNEIIGKDMSNIIKNFDLQNKIKLDFCF